MIALTRLVVFALGGVLFSGVAHAQPNFSTQVMAAYEAAQRGLPPPDPRLSALLRAKQFVFYPGSGGARNDVYVDQLRTLQDDFGVDVGAWVKIRDVEALYGRGVASVREVTERESEYLRGRYEESKRVGPARPLVILSHSAYTREMMLATVALLGDGAAGVGDLAIVDRAVAMSPSGAVGARSVRRYLRQGWEALLRFSGAEDYAVRMPIDYARADLERRLAATPSLRGILDQRVAIIRDEGSELVAREFGMDWGTFGVVGERAHIAPVVAAPRSLMPYEYRRALTRTVMARLYGFSIDGFPAAGTRAAQ